ncbi:MAG: Asp23/Gls24 family envelope stress response protein [Candidatus Caldatribacteriaceae bacterium]
MRYCEVALDGGKVLYSPRVVQRIVESLIKDVPGVGSLEKGKGESIRLDGRKDIVSLNIFLILTLERRVPETAWELQKRVKEKIERELLLRVEQINIYVQGFQTGNVPSLSWQEAGKI